MDRWIDDTCADDPNFFVLYIIRHVQQIQYFILDYNNIYIHNDMHIYINTYKHIYK